MIIDIEFIAYAVREKLEQASVANSSDAERLIRECKLLSDRAVKLTTLNEELK